MTVVGGEILRRISKSKGKFKFFKNYFYGLLIHFHVYLFLSIYHLVIWYAEKMFCNVEITE